MYPHLSLKLEQETPDSVTSRKVLVCNGDNSEPGLSVLTKWQSSPELEVCESQDTFSALTMLQQNTYDALIFNLGESEESMADLQGIHRVFPLLPIVAVASVEQLDTATELVRQGVDAYLLREQLSPGLIELVVNQVVESATTEAIQSVWGN